MPEPEWLAEATAAYRAGTSLRSLAAQHRTSRARLRQLLVKQEIDIVRPRPIADLPEDPAWWQHQFDTAGQTVTTLAASLAVSTQTIYRHLIRIGEQRGGAVDFDTWLQSHTRTDGDHLLWVGARMRDGFPLTRRDGVAVAAHRVVWEHHHADLDPEALVVHTSNCATRACVAIGHLTVVTQTEWFAQKSADRAFAWGQQHWNSKLTETQVRQILSGRHETASHLARQFGVSPSAVSMIRSGRRWRHVRDTLVNKQESITPDEHL